MAASWPTSVASDSTLYVAVNELQNNLSGAINAAVTTIGLNSTTSFPTVGLVLIDNEVIKYTGVSGLNLTGCTRGFDGTTAASHSSAAVVSFAFCAAHHNNLKDEIIALETSLNLTPSKALSSDVNGRVAAATTSLAELNFVAGVTSAIQTQIDTKAPSASPTFTGTVTTPVTASRAVTTGASSQLAVSTTTAAELDLVHGVTSAIQTQIDTKAAKAGQQFTGNISFDNNSTHGVVGTTTNDDAAAGNLGETISASVLRSAAVSVSTGTPKTIATISLTAGDWDIFYGIGFRAGGATAITTLIASVSLTTNTLPASDATLVGTAAGEVQTSNQSPVTPGSGNDVPVVGLPVRAKVSGTTNYFLVADAVFSGSTLTAYGSIVARRRR